MIFQHFFSGPRHSICSCDSVGGAGACWVLVIPLERKFPKVRIQTRQAAELLSQRVVVVLDGWDAASTYPHGHYVRSLGALGDVNAETNALMLEHDVDARPFSEAVHQCVPPLPWVCTEEDVNSPVARVDLRHLVVCSVDPPGCRDIDDALHARELPVPPEAVAAAAGQSVRRIEAKHYAPRQP